MRGFLFKKHELIKNLRLEKKLKNYSGIDNDKDIYSMIIKGMSAYAISKNTKYSKSTILRFMHRENILLHKSKRDDNNLLKDKKDKVIELHEQGLSQNQIAEIVGHSSSSICKLIQKLNLQPREWKYKVNESFFSNLEHQDQAYVLGWFFSDGCVSNEGKCRIQIQEEDRKILEKIKDVIGYNGPLYEIPPPKKFPHRKPQVCLCINRQSIAKDLIDYGCVPSKSLILKYPQIPKNLESHFIRGVFDGDGSISIKKEKYLNTSITSSTIFNNSLKELLKKHNILSNTYHKKKKINTSTLMMTSTNEAIKFCNFIYDGSILRMKRKYDIYQSFINGV